MSILLEVNHQISPATPNRFADYVTRYGECAVPVMERCGWDVLGGWKWSTRELFTDLVLVRFDSLADFEVATARLKAEREKGAFEPLAEFGIRESIRLATPVQYGTDERLTKALESSSADQPRQFIYARLKTHVDDFQEACEAMEKTLEHARDTSLLAAGYTFLTGEQGELVDLWASTAGTMEMAWQENAPRVPEDYDNFYRLIEYETIDYLNPLPYSKLR